MSRKAIVCDVELVPNYLLHLLASARVCFDSAYADKYESTVEASSVQFLRENRQLLSWGSGGGGELSEFVVTLPIIFELKSEKELSEYFELLIGALSTKSTEEFFRKYATVIEQLERTWFPLNQEALMGLAPLTEKLETCQEIVRRNFRRYEQSVWPDESRQMEKVAGELNDYFKGRDIIGKWEELTRKVLATAKYTIVLSSAIEGGPNANSMGYAKNMFSSRRSMDWTRDFISHEVGIHILMSEFRKLAESGKYEWRQLYGANECLAQFLNGIVLDKAVLAYDLQQFGSMESIPRYREAFNLGGKLNYADLIGRAIQEKRN
ncbi:MAG: hypothetical protein WBP29_00590 [Candidatus Zixiibacteriota bacterium]